MTLLEDNIRLRADLARAEMLLERWVTQPTDRKPLINETTRQRFINVWAFQDKVQRIKLMADKINGV